MNNVILMGRLARDPEVRYTQNGKAVAGFTLAVDRPFKNEQGEKEADFINIVMWGKPAEVVGNSVCKGQRLLVSGRLQVRSYQAQDGSKKYVTEVVADSFEYIERREQSGFASMGEQIPMGGNEEIPF